MKMMKLLAMAALGLTASTAIAQSHPSAPGMASSTVSGVFIPLSYTSGVATNVTGTITAPSATPVTPTARPEAAASAVMAGNPASIASFTQALTASGIPGSAAQGIASALQQLGSAPTVGSVLTAAASWNAAIASLTPAQVTALTSTPQGLSSLRAMYHAFKGATAAR
ncbi:MAG: hypothetical protein HY824_03555 [Acidobacteria bacterium]|nr:hypothetical protein [Acidobacteriota bacterium]